MKIKIIISILIGIFVPLLALGDSVGPNSPTSAVGKWVNPINVFTSDNVYATDGTVGDTMACYDYGFSIPGGAIINGILVEPEGNCTGTGCDIDIGLLLSWNGGITWTAQKDILPDAIEGYDPAGGSADTWGRTWSVSEFANANFRCKLLYSSELNVGDGYRCDHVRITIYYTVGGGARRRKFAEENNEKVYSCTVTLLNN